MYMQTFVINVDMLSFESKFNSRPLTILPSNNITFYTVRQLIFACLLPFASLVDNNTLELFIDPPFVCHANGNGSVRQPCVVGRMLLCPHPPPSL